MRWFPSDRFAWRTLLVAAGFELSLGVVAWMVARPFGIDVLETVRVSSRALVNGVLATVPMVLALACMLRWPMAPLAELVRKMRHFAQTILAPCGIVGLAVISISAGVGEEFLVRGFVHTLALSHMPGIVALVITGVLFGLMHPISPAYVTIAAIIGVYLGLVWTVPSPQPNLIAPITAHALYDFVALLVLCRGPQRAGSAFED